MMICRHLTVLAILVFAWMTCGCAEELTDEFSVTSAPLEDSEEADLERQLRALPNASERMRERYRFADRMAHERASEVNASTGRQAAARRYITDDSVPQADIQELSEEIAAAARAHVASPEERVAEEEYQQTLQRFRNSRRIEETE
jgi:hypothetical protein